MPDTFTIANPGADASPTSIGDVVFGFRQGYVIEVVQTTEPVKSLATFVFPIAPRIYNLGEPFTSVETPTQGNTVITEENGIILRDITLEGTFGLSPKRATGFAGVQAGGRPVSGTEHFRLLRNLFRKYGEFKKDPVLGPQVQMRFHSLREDDHFIVVPKQFETPRDARSTRVHYDYRITLRAIGVAGEVNAPRSVSDDTNAFRNALSDISRSLNDARAFFSDANAFLVNNVQRGVFGNLQAVMLQAGSVINAVSNFLRTGAGFINMPFQFAANVAAQIEQLGDDLESAVLSPLDNVALAARNIRKLGQSLNRILAWPDRFESNWNNKVRTIERAFAGERTISQRDVIDQTAGATPGTRTRVAYGTEGEAGIVFGDYTAVISVPVDRTTSLLGLASRYGVPPELIIVVNDLSAPYFTTGGGAGTLSPGDSILIPVPTAGARDTGSVVGSGYLPADVILYGRDFAIDMPLFSATGRFDVMADTVHGGLDASLVEGLPNLVQGTMITMETERGETVFLPDIGLFRTVGKKNTISNLMLASLNLREAILGDPRIDSISSMAVVQDGDVLTQEITAVPIGRRTGITLVRPIGTAAGGG